MKQIHYIILSMLLLFTVACKKENVEMRPTSTLNVINAIVGAGAIKVNPGATGSFNYRQAAEVGYGSSYFYSAFTGSKHITVVSAADTTKTLVAGTMNLQAVNTLYLTGQSSNIDTLIRVENIPAIQSVGLYPDNSVYIRFVNLSPDSPPLSVNLKNIATSEVNALAYKGISGFKKYPAEATTPTYIFEVRNASTNELLFTTPTNVYTANNIRYKTISLVIRGLVGTSAGANAFGMFQVTYL